MMLVLNTFLRWTTQNGEGLHQREARGVQPVVAPEPLRSRASIKAIKSSRLNNLAANETARRFQTLQARIT
ncbi:hypothetical protein, partial [Serratia liquefaciens]|uniref:hypothetical protein n=1 Tax=Serratia liquefaciens TaxID=614 RepID=UPI001A91B798